ncbi:MAG: hypothetical protein ABIB61_03210 [Candidatus Shapirobacteria bacterium]
MTKIQEGIEYFFTFRNENKVAVLEKHAEKKLFKAQSYAEEGNNEKVQNLLQNYVQLKEKQANLLGKTDDGKVIEAAENRTIEQQKTMEEIKAKINEDQKQNIIQAQEQVVNQMAQKIVEVSGVEGQAEFFDKVEHVWAPGTGPGEGEPGVIIEGGTMQFAPGTSSGGPAGSNIKTVEIKTGGGVNDPVPVQEGTNSAPGTRENSPRNTIDSGVVDPGDPGSSPN